MKIEILLSLLKGKKSKRGNYWLFNSFYGEYSDSPKVLSELLHEKRPDIDIVWMLRDDVTEVPDYIHRVSINAKDVETIRHSAAVLVDNIYGENGLFVKKGLVQRNVAKLLIWLRKARGQKIYTTWHGIPLKCLGRDEIESDYTDFICNDITMFVNSAYEEHIMRHVTFDKVKIHKLGMPRNDNFFYPYNRELKRIAAMERLSISANKHVLLYAPTFRRSKGIITKENLLNSGINQLEQINISLLLQTLKNKTGDEWVFVCRFHSQVSGAVDWEQIENEYHGNVINGNVIIDLADLLASTDILITDASSCMFDFMLTGRPCFLFFPDIDIYSRMEQGLYMSVEDLPFPLAEDSKQLMSLIETFNKNEYKTRVNSLIEKWGCIDDGKSGERILNFILRDQGII